MSGGGRQGEGKGQHVFQLSKNGTGKLVCAAPPWAHPRAKYCTDVQCCSAGSQERRPRPKKNRGQGLRGAAGPYSATLLTLVAHRKGWQGVGKGEVVGGGTFVLTILIVDNDHEISLRHGCGCGLDGRPHRADGRQRFVA